MDKQKIARELVSVARDLAAADTFKCPKCDSKVLEQTGYCVKCKKKVKKAKDLRASEAAKFTRAYLSLKDVFSSRARKTLVNGEAMMEAMEEFEVNPALLNNFDKFYDYMQDLHDGVSVMFKAVKDEPIPVVASKNLEAKEFVADELAAMLKVADDNLDKLTDVQASVRDELVDTGYIDEAKRNRNYVKYHKAIDEAWGALMAFRRDLKEMD